jgi:hypothetical protein
MAEMSQGPVFFCVGAQKCGTTALHHHLAAHPQVYLPSIKETHFFTDAHGEYERGIDFYLRRYFSSSTQGRVAGEIDPDYLFFPFVPPRLAESFPNAKLIFLFRDPVARAYSHYWMSFRRGLETLPFAEAVLSESARLRGSLKEQSHFSYVARGYYYQQVGRYLQYFPRENMRFFLADDLKHNPEKTLKQIYDFLGLEHAPLQPVRSSKANQAALPISSGLQSFMANSSVTKRIGRALLPERVRYYIGKFIETYNRRPAQLPPMAPVTEASLRELYKDDIRSLSKLIARDLSGWLDQSDDIPNSCDPIRHPQ